MATAFQHRCHAGVFLAQHLEAYANRPDVLVLALPRGGVPVRGLKKEGSMPTPSNERKVRAGAGREKLDGILNLPAGARAIVVFAHGSGSSRHSPRNRGVAELLNEAGLATLLVDLLTFEEEVVDRRTARLRIDIRLLAERLSSVTDWLGHNKATRHLRIGYFGASTGAAAALTAAAERPSAVGAIVSRGGRPDLAGAYLARVHAPTLLIVGGNDWQVLELNRAALAQLRREKELVIIPGASHLFEEPGALDEVALLARDWFERHLTPTTQMSGSKTSHA